MISLKEAVKITRMEDDDVCYLRDEKKDQYATEIISVRNIRNKYDMKNTYVTIIQPRYSCGQFDDLEFILRSRPHRDRFSEAMREVYASVKENLINKDHGSFFRMFHAYHCMASCLKRLDPKEYKKFISWFCHEGQGQIISTVTGFRHMEDDGVFYEAMLFYGYIGLYAERLEADYRVDLHVLYDLPRQISRTLAQYCRDAGMDMKGEDSHE